MVRNSGGRRWWGIVAGASIGIFGFVLASCFELAHEPSFNETNFDTSLANVRYVVPDCLWQVGLILMAAGAVIVFGTWITSPRWSAATPLGPTARQELSAAGMLALSVLAAVVVGTVAARRSRETRDLLGLPLAVPVIWVVVRARRRRR